EAPLAEGRHFRNPLFYEWKIVPAIKIPAGKVGIVTSKVGTELPAGEFLADKGQKGVWKRVLGPGVYRLNPLGYKIDIVDAISIPIGYVGVVTSLSGAKAPESSFANVGQKGVRADILQPGLYYVNNNAYKVDVIEVGLNQVSILGREGGRVITKGQMGMQNKAMEELQSNMLEQQKQKRQSYIDSEMMSQALQSEDSSSFTSRSRKKMPPQTDKQTQAIVPKPGLKEGTITTLGLAQFVEFPSRDGFEIMLDMTLEFEFLPSKVAELYLRYGDLPAVVDKIIMPQILSVSRLKGSSYKAQDFIVGEGREKFQDELREALLNVLGEKDIKVHKSLIRHVHVPQDILDPIQQASIAIERNLTNIQKQETAKKQAELNTQETMIDQKKQEVMQETEKIVAEIGAKKEMQVASIRAQTEKKVAEIAK
ncbi:MAG: SPFH domain-containing protein, partial [Candidatus Nanoarchaeia archaeon]